MMTPIVVLLAFPLFCGHFGGFLGSWNPDSPTVLLGSQNGPFHTPKTLRFEGKCPISTQESQDTQPPKQGLDCRGTVPDASP